MDLKQESEIVNKILDNFQSLKTENAKLKLANEKLRKQLKATEENLYNRVSFLNEKIEQNEKLEKENRELKDALYDCEEIYIFLKIYNINWKII
jgi:regulator of replication initiation timing